MNRISKTILLCLLAAPVLAQTKKEPSLQDFQREMLEMQRQLMQQFQQLAPGSAPEFKWDTTFSFQFDTTFGGNGMSRHFFFSPFGQDTSGMRDLFGGNLFPEGFNPFGEGFQWPFSPGGEQPNNDENSALDDTGDGLLPEERLREEPGKSAQPAEKSTTPTAKKPKIKTIRI